MAIAVTAVRRDDLTPLDRIVRVVEIAERPINTAEVAAHVARDTNHVRQCLLRLERDGCVRRVGAIPRNAERHRGAALWVAA